uniref:Uncharacterized protein n=1 Tax=Romanomermis culicivorax TaxID=13658 RepID=A0A915KDU7_ROMCU
MKSFETASTGRMSDTAAVRPTDRLAPDHHRIIVARRDVEPIDEAVKKYNVAVQSEVGPTDLIANFRDPSLSFGKPGIEMAGTEMTGAKSAGAEMVVQKYPRPFTQCFTIDFSLSFFQVSRYTKCPVTISVPLRQECYKSIYEMPNIPCVPLPQVFRYPIAIRMQDLLQLIILKFGAETAGAKVTDTKMAGAEMAGAEMAGAETAIAEITQFLTGWHLNGVVEVRRRNVGTETCLSILCMVFICLSLVKSLCNDENPVAEVTSILGVTGHLE